ncbi:MAG: AAA family ATPase, partial [Spirochaetales bacterium]|nr:AAA family ATPase [Spirochaetales bacterium]
MIVERNIQKQIISQLDKDTILLLIGARQVGKTTLLRFCKKLLEKRGKRVFYFTLEDPALLEDLDNHPEQIFKYMKIDPSVKSFLLLDEIQYLKNPSNFLKYLYDQYSENIKIICTGSSAFY